MFSIQDPPSSPSPQITPMNFHESYLKLFFNECLKNGSLSGTRPDIWTRTWNVASVFRCPTPWRRRCTPTPASSTTSSARTASSGQRSRIVRSAARALNRRSQPDIFWPKGWFASSQRPKALQESERPPTSLLQVALMTAFHGGSTGTEWKSFTVCIAPKSSSNERNQAFQTCLVVVMSPHLQLSYVVQHRIYKPFCFSSRELTNGIYRNKTKKLGHTWENNYLPFIFQELHTRLVVTQWLSASFLAKRAWVWLPLGTVNFVF